MADESQGRPGRPGKAFGRLVGSVVSPVIGNLDLDEMIDQVDVDDVVSRIDIDEVVSRIDIDEVVSRIDIDEAVSRIDLERLIAQVDLDEVLSGVDVDRLLGRVDPDALLDRVDPNRLLDRVDPDRLLDRVDPDRLVDRVDANRLLDRVDVNQLVSRTELGEIIARSTTGVFTQLLDVARTQIIGVDQVAQGVPARVLRGARRELPPAPGGAAEEPESARLSPTERAVKVQGRFAGSVSRFLAFLVDQFVIGLVFVVGTLLVQTAVQVVLRSSFEINDESTPVVVAFAVWWFVYTAGSLAATGSTIGKAILGLRVVRRDGRKLDGRHAVTRTLMFPLSFLLLGLGFLMGLVRRDRCELHDRIADTGVVYAWDADTAQLRSPDVGAENGVAPPA